MNIQYTVKITEKGATVIIADTDIEDHPAGAEILSKSTTIMENVQRKLDKLLNKQ